MSGGFELGEGFGVTPLEPASPVRHEVLIVAPGVSPIEHAGRVVVSEAADVAVPIMINDGVVMDLVAGGRVSTERARTSVLLNHDDTVTASGHLDPVAIDLHVLGILNVYIAAPTPSARVTVTDLLWDWDQSATTPSRRKARPYTSPSRMMQMRTGWRAY